MIATWTLVVIGCVIAIRDYVDSRDRPQTSRIVGVALGIAVAVIGGYREWSAGTESDARDFRDANATVISGGVGPGRLAAVFAGSGINVNPTGGPVRVSNDGDFVAEIDPNSGKLLFDANVRDETGRVILGIRKNEVWWGDSPDFDRNFKEDAFELFDRQLGLPRLQVSLINHVVIVNGIFFTSQGIPVVYTPTMRVAGPSAERMSEIRETLCPWFVYPSELHPGAVDGACMKRSMDSLERFYTAHPAAKLLLERGKPYTYEEYEAAVRTEAPR